jgi:hypothetical protein
MVRVNTESSNNFIIDSSGSHLYRIGLSLFPYGNKPRYRFCKPMLICITMIIYLFKSISSLFFNINRNIENFHIYIGDCFYFLGFKIHGNLVIIFGIFLIITSQLSYYKFYKNGVKPCYMKPFDMMYGLITPYSIGIYNHNDVIRLFNKTKLLFNIFEKITRSTIPLCFFFSFIPLAKNSTVIEIFMFSIPWSLFNTLFF